MLSLPPRRYRTTRRSIRLFRSFLQEQSRPDLFYADLAQDTIATLEEWAPVAGATVVDVGCGPEQFAKAFITSGALYAGLDVDVHSFVQQPGTTVLVAEGERLPFRDDSADIVLSSNVMEHVRQPGKVAAEMLRVARPGGLVLISYTAWYSPWGGHETSPWHYLGGHRAARRYERRYGRPPKNHFGKSMFAAHVGPGVAWARRQEMADVLLVAPRYHPAWATWVVRVPAVREIASWNLLLVLRKRAE